jgi:hypothetical protein
VLGRRSAGGSGAPVPGGGRALDLRQPDLKLRVLSGFARASTAEAEGMERSDGALISCGPFLRANQRCHASLASWTAVAARGFAGAAW